MSLPSVTRQTNAAVPIWLALLILGTVAWHPLPSASGQPANQLDHNDWSTWRGNAIPATGAVALESLASSSGAPKGWTVELPGRGCSTPILFGNQLYLTGPSQDKKDSLFCLDTQGQQKWQVSFGKHIAGRHRNDSGSNASPASDRSQVYVYLKSGLLAAVNHQGEKAWERNLIDEFGKVNLYFSYSTTPVLTQDYVVMARMHEGDSWIAAFNKSDGQLAWKTARNYKSPREGDHGYGSPLLMQYNGQPALLTYGAQHLTVHAVTDGKLLFERGGFNPKSINFWPTVASPVAVGDIAIVASGRADKRIPRLHGVRLDGPTGNESPEHLWDRNDIGTFVPTPAIYQGHVLLLGDTGDVRLIDPETGESTWQHQFPRRGKTAFYSSPLVVGSRLYAVRENGDLYIADITDDGLENVRVETLGESIIASPIPIDRNRVLLRGEKRLFCLVDERKR